MTSTPDSVSMSDLMAFSEQAQERETEQKLEAPKPFPNERTADEFHKDVLEGLEKLHEDNMHPMFAKVVAISMLSKLMEWHTERGKSEFTEDNTDCGVCWLRDAGKLQAAMQMLHNVGLPDDYLISE